MELNEKDLELIAKIDERLKHYKLITDNEQADKEVYIECLLEFKDVENGKIYKATETRKGYNVYTEKGIIYNCSFGVFKPSTKEAYLKQFLPDNEQQAPVEWKDGHCGENSSIHKDNIPELITEQKERWKIDVVNFRDVPYFYIQIDNIDGDLSKEEAERAAQAIRETLKNL